jgi:hypothetical protein
VPLDLRLLAHGDQIASWRFASDAPATLSVTLPAAMVARAALLPLELVAGEPRAPAALGLGVAAESAGFGLIGFTLHSAGESPPRARLRLAEDAPLRIASGQPTAQDGALRAALGAEWHAREPGATWSFGHEALLPLRLDPPPRGALLLKAEIEGFRPAPDAPLIGFEALAGDTPLIRQAMRPGEARGHQRVDCGEGWWPVSHPALRGARMPAALFISLELLFLAIALHGISYDFFFVTGFIYADKAAPATVRSQVQSMLVFFTQGIGMYFGYQIADAKMTAHVGGHAALATAIKEATVPQTLSYGEKLGQMFSVGLPEVNPNLLQAASAQWKTFWVLPAAMAGAIAVLFFIFFWDKSADGGDSKH